MADQSKLCTITNSTGKDVVVALTVSDDETASQDAVMSASQQFEILKTSAGNTVIKNGSTHTVALDHNYKDGADETGYLQNYDLIISDSNWLYPLADLSVQQGSNGTASYASQTVDAASQAPMVQAFDFYQTIAAYPSSQLAIDYMTALQQAQDAASTNADGSPDSAKAVADAIENAMESFFKGTDQYKDVTLADIVAVDNYYNNFPYVWAQYKDSITYYLYGSDGTTAVFSGTLSLAKSGAIDITKPNGGYTCSFAPAVNPADTSKTDVDKTKSINLTYRAGLFLDDPAVAAPAIGLKGSLMLARLFTSNPDDNNVISVLTGTVNGVTCIGFDTPQPAQSNTTSQQTATSTALSGSPAEAFWDTLIHPKDQKDLIVSIVTLVGAILLIPVTAFVIYRIYRFVKNKQQANEPASREGIESKRNALTESRREGLEQGWGSPRETYTYTPLTPEQREQQRIEAEIPGNIIKSVKLKMALNRQNRSLQDALQYSAQLEPETVTLIQQSMGSVRDIMNQLAIPNEDLGPVLPDAYKSFSVVTDNLRQINTAVNLQLNKQEQERMEWTISDCAGIFKTFEDSTLQEQKEESDINPKLQEKIVPEEISI